MSLGQSAVRRNPVVQAAAKRSDVTFYQHAGTRPPDTFDRHRPDLHGTGCAIYMPPVCQGQGKLPNLLTFRIDLEFGNRTADAIDKR